MSEPRLFSYRDVHSADLAGTIDLRYVTRVERTCEGYGPWMDTLTVYMLDGGSFELAYNYHAFCALWRGKTVGFRKPEP